MRWVPVFKKEMRLYFGSPVAYAFLALFLLIAGWMFSQIFLIYSEMSMRSFMQPMGAQNLNPTESVMRPVFSNMSVVLLFFIPMLSLGGIPPFSGFLGKLALFEAGAQDGSVLAWILIGSGALVSLLTLYALARAWSMTFWRDAAEVADYENPLQVLSTVGASTEVRTARSIPRIMIGATAAMVALSVALTVFAGPLYDVSARAGHNIDGPEYYITVVFTGESQ